MTRKTSRRARSIIRAINTFPQKTKELKEAEKLEAAARKRKAEAEKKQADDQAYLANQVRKQELRRLAREAVESRDSIRRDALGNPVWDAVNQRGITSSGNPGFKPPAPPPVERTEEPPPPRNKTRVEEMRERYLDHHRPNTTFGRRSVVVSFADPGGVVSWNIEAPHRRVHVCRSLTGVWDVRKN